MSRNFFLFYSETCSIVSISYTPANVGAVCCVHCARAGGTVEQSGMHTVLTCGCGADPIRSAFYLEQLEQASDGPALQARTGRPLATNTSDSETKSLIIDGSIDRQRPALIMLKRRTNPADRSRSGRGWKCGTEERDSARS